MATSASTVKIMIVNPDDGTSDIVVVPVASDGVNPDPLALKQALAARGLESDGVPVDVRNIKADYVAFVDDAPAGPKSTKKPSKRNP